MAVEEELYQRYQRKVEMERQQREAELQQRLAVNQAVQDVMDHYRIPMDIHKIISMELLRLRMREMTTR